MSRQYKLAKSATRDIRELLAFVRQSGGPGASIHVESGILDACRRIAAMPGIGHRREDFTAGDLRFYTIWSYYIIYKPDSDPLEIVRIISSSRDMAAAMDEIA